MNIKNFLFVLLFVFSCNESEPVLEAPDIITTEVQESSFSALVRAEILKVGDLTIIDHGFVLASHTEPTLSDSKIALGPTDQLGLFKGTFKNLDPESEYYVRGFAKTDDDKITYGNTLSFKTFGSNIWINKTDFAGGYLTGAVSFVIEDKLFVGTGINNVSENYFYEYDYDEDSWKKISSLPADERSDAISFAIGNYGYVGLGESCKGLGLCTHYYYNDLWRYDPQNGRWKKMADFPGTPRSNSTSFVIGDKAYVTCGSTYGDRDLWEYNSQTDTWTKKSDYPGRCISRALSFSLNGKGYVGFGWSDGTCKDFWEYDPASDQWTLKGEFPGPPRYDAVAFSLNDKGYILGGMNQGFGYYEFQTDLWEYNQSSDSWKRIRTAYPGMGRVDMIAGVVENKIIMGLGSNSIAGGPGSRFEDIWEYIPEQK